MKIETWLDYSCPFCYIGKRKLENAINRSEYKDEIQIIYKSFQLSPDADLEPTGNSYEVFSKLKNIPIEQVKEMFNDTEKLGKEFDLEFNMKEIKMVSTLKAHRLAKWVRKFNKEHEITELFQKAYFTTGLNISDNETLLSFVRELELDENEALEVLNSDQYLDVVEAEIEEARQLEVTGVPFFVFNEEYVISGAQEDAYFDEAIRLASKESI